MTLLSTVINTVMVVSITGASAVLLYIMLKKRDDDDEARRRGLPTVGNSGQQVTVEFVIPREAVGVVIGRQGCNITHIQEKTRTRIKFKDHGQKETARVCLITGKQESVEYARTLIQDLIRNQPLIMTSEMFVPSKAIGRIIGRCGENIQQIIVASGAKVNVDGDTRQRERDQYGPRRVVLKGTADQISAARSLIDSKVAEEAELRKRYETGAASRSPRKANKTPGYLTMGEAAQAEEEAPHAERLEPMSSDESMEVYLSAVESPELFWVQMITPSAAELDQLVEQMTDYYSKPENQDIHRLEKVKVEDRVAATFKDNKWYRAKVVSVTPNEYEPDETEVELFYVDYGDTYDLKLKELFDVRTDFLKLRPQAILCALAHVKPVGDDWSDEAVDLFEELTFSAQWKVIICKIDHYDHDHKHKDHRGKREGSPVPMVELFNISGPKDINVGDELVKNQFAAYINPAHAARKSRKGKADSNGSDAEGAGDSRGVTATTVGVAKAEDGGGDGGAAAVNGNS